MQVMQASFFLSLPISEEVLNEEVKYSWNLSLFGMYHKKIGRFSVMPILQWHLKFSKLICRPKGFSLFFDEEWNFVELIFQKDTSGSQIICLDTRCQISTFLLCKLPLYPLSLKRFYIGLHSSHIILTEQNAILQFHTFQPQNCNKINSLILQFYFTQY